MEHLLPKPKLIALPVSPTMHRIGSCKNIDHCVYTNNNAAEIHIMHRETVSAYRNFIFPSQLPQFTIYLLFSPLVFSPTFPSRSGQPTPSEHIASPPTATSAMQLQPTGSKDRSPNLGAFSLSGGRRASGSSPSPSSSSATATATITTSSAVPSVSLGPSYSAGSAAASGGYGSRGSSPISYSSAMSSGGGMAGSSSGSGMGGASTMASGGSGGTLTRTNVARGISLRRETPSPSGSPRFPGIRGGGSGEARGGGSAFGGGGSLFSLGGSRAGAPTGMDSSSMSNGESFNWEPDWDEISSVASTPRHAHSQAQVGSARARQGVGIGFGARRGSKQGGVGGVAFGVGVGLAPFGTNAALHRRVCTLICLLSLVCTLLLMMWQGSHSASWGSPLMEHPGLTRGNAMARSDLSTAGHNMQASTGSTSASTSTSTSTRGQQRRSHQHQHQHEQQGK